MNDQRTNSKLEIRKAQADRPMLAIFLEDDLRSGWTETEATDDFRDFLGVRNGQGFRLLVEELQSLPTDRATGLKLLAALSGRSTLICSEAVGEELIDYLRDAAIQLADFMR